MAKNKSKPAYSTFSNIVYTMKLQWKYGRMGFIFLISKIPVSLGLSFIPMFIPKIVLSEVMSTHPVSQIILTVSAICTVLAILNMTNSLMYTYDYAANSRYIENIMLLKNTKSVYTDYENLESPKVRLMLQRISDMMWMSGNSSAFKDMSANVVYFVINLIGFILSGAIISFASPWIAVLLIISALINYFLVKWIQNYQHSRREETSAIGRKLWYLANNSGAFESIKDIRMYGMNTWFVNMYKTLTKQHLKIDAAIARRAYIPDIAEALIILLRDGFAYVFLIAMVVSGEITVDNFVLYFAAIGTFANKINRLFSGMNSVNSTSLSICDLRDYLDYPEKSNRDKGCELPDKNQACEIELKNLSYKYEGNETDTISGISLKIKAGEKIAVVGLNGAGKTTLIKNICGLYNPTEGTILVNGHEKNEYNLFDYYSMFAVVFQDFHFLPVSIAQIVSGKSDEETDKEKVIECLRLAGLEKKIESLKFGIDTKLNKQLNEDAVEFSGGEKQKLLIARAIYKNAPILILDEPTAALDPIAESELYHRYNEITRNKTSIYISHRLASTRFCDRIILLEDGKIAETGSHDELIKQNGKYAYLFNIQSHYYKENAGGEINQ